MAYDHAYFQGNYVENSLEGDNVADLGTLRFLFGQTTRNLEGMESLLVGLQLQKEKLEEEHEILEARQEAIVQNYIRLMKEENPGETYDDDDLRQTLHIESCD
jgi:hypothetical protein